MIHNGKWIDGRKLPKPRCEHVWVDTTATETHQLSKCNLCDKMKQRRLSTYKGKRTYRPRMASIGINVSGVPYRFSRDTSALPTVFRGLSRA